MIKTKLKPLSLYCALCVCLLCGVSAIYEDQVGNFDWIQRYIGPVESVVFDQSSSPSRRVVVSTAQNVVAALSTKSGDILWRHVLESPDNGKIELLSTHDHYASVVIGNLVRTWDIITAALRSEVLLDFTPHWTDSHLYHLFEFGTNNEDLFLVEVSIGNIHVTIFDATSGAIVSQRSIPCPWVQLDTRCAIAGDTLVCLDLIGDGVHSLNIVSGNANFTSRPTSSLGFSEVTKQEGSANPSTVAVLKSYGSADQLLIKVGNKQKLIHAHKEGIHLIKDFSNIQAIAFDGDTLFTVTQSLRTLTLHAFDMSTGNELAEQGVVVELPLQSGTVQSLAIHCFNRKDGGIAIRAFLTCSDHSVHLISSAGVVWSRDEALAQILSVEAIDLPIAGAAASFQDPLAYDAGLFTSLFHRMRNQASQVMNWFLSVFGRKDQFDEESMTLTRDQFNMRKLVVVVTSSGKVLALDTWTGEIIWSLFFPELSPFKNENFLLFTQRTSTHFPRSPQCVITGKHKVTGEGLLIVFNPLTGEGIGENGGIIPLGYPLLQASLLQQMDEDYIKPLLLIDTDWVPHVFPKSGEVVVLQWKQSLYTHLAHPDSSLLAGYSLRNSKPGNLVLSEVWSLSLASSGSITGLYGKRTNEKVHSQGRVLADRSVLYKYSNPNLVVVTTFGQDNLSKNTLTVHLIDTVTGTILESVTHKRVTGPFHIVHSENWIVYTSYNEKFRRHEVTTLELFEGLEQSNVTAFSAFGAKATPPIVERQAFILPQGVQATAHTTTEKGITTKFILFALNTGNVLQMSKWFLDPRRPMSHGGPREEGLIPYMPELPLPPQEMINHNQTLPRVRAIYTSPTGLESTCLVLVYGLDVFYTRLFPSKTFDVLKDDFDYYLIFGALSMLIGAALITRKLSQRKALKQAWK